MYKSIDNEDQRVTRLFLHEEQTFILCKFQKQKWTAWIEGFLYARLDKLNEELVDKEFILNSVAFLF